MGREKRVHPRVPCQVKVAYSFVSWKDDNLGTIPKPIITEANDISVIGIGLPQMETIKHSLQKKLIEGKKKIKLEISLFEDRLPVIIFARLVWVDLNEEIKEHTHRGGLQFIDLSGDSYRKISEYVDNHLK